MDHTKDKSVRPISNTPPRRRRVNWHEAAACAIEIDLRDYADMLQFLSEYILGKNSYRIDFLVIRKLSGQTIPRNIARIFRTYNLFEFKGLHSSLTVSAYYKVIGYAGLFINQLSSMDSKQYSSLDISISFLTFRFPRKLLRHLTEERNLAVEKFSKGIYYINIETFHIQIIVTRELPPDENLYLHCLTNNIRDTSLIRRLADDCAMHQEEDVYRKYLDQLTTASTETKGGHAMVSEGLLNLFGTSSAEIIANTRKESEAKINEQAETIKQLSFQNNYLKELLRKNNISFE